MSKGEALKRAVVRLPDGGQQGLFGCEEFRRSQCDGPRRAKVTFNEGTVEALYIGCLTVEEHRRVTGEHEAFVVQSGRTDAVGSGAKRECKQIPKSEFVYEEGADIYWRPQGERRVAVGRFRGNETAVVSVEYGTKAFGGCVRYERDVRAVSEAGESSATRVMRRRRRCAG